MPNAYPRCLPESAARRRSCQMLRHMFTSAAAPRYQHSPLRTPRNARSEVLFLQQRRYQFPAAYPQSAPLAMRYVQRRANVLPRDVIAALHKGGGDAAIVYRKPHAAVRDARWRRCVVSSRPGAATPALHKRAVKREGAPVACSSRRGAAAFCCHARQQGRSRRTRSVSAERCRAASRKRFLPLKHAICPHASAQEEEHRPGRSIEATYIPP